MTDNDHSIDQAILASRPNPTGPDPDVIEQHRASLNDAVASAPREALVGANPDHGRSAVEIDLSPITTRRRSSRRRHAVLAAAAVAILVGGTVALVNQRDTSTQLDTETVSADQPDPTNPAAAADPDLRPGVEPVSTDPLCGTEFPVDLVFADTTVVQDGPLDDSGPVLEGQLVKHWTQEGVSVELRWPQEPKLTYGDAPPATLATTYAEANTPDGGIARIFYAHAGAFPVGDGDEMAAMLGLDGDALRIVDSTHGSAAPDGSLSTDEVLEPAFGLGVHDGTPDEGCGLIQARFVAENGAQALIAFDITDPQQTVDVNPFVINQIEASETPTAVVACEGAGTEPGVAAFVDEAIAVDTHSATPIEAFQYYLDSASHATSGYTEIAHPAGVTYAHPFDENTYTALINVTDSTEGWAVTHTRTSGC